MRQEAYAMKHDEQLTLFDGARNKLKQLGIKPNISELKQVNSDVAELEKIESELEKKCESSKKMLMIWITKRGTKIDRIMCCNFIRTIIHY